MLVQIAVVTSAVALWAWLLADCANRFVRLWNGSDPDDGPPVLNKRRALIAAPFILIASVAITYRLHLDNPVPPRTALPCTDDGVDFDTRDGLCYKLVPLRFQRQ
jgi:hypothetical protein